MTSWWQRKLFQYTVSRLGLFEDGAFNFDDLNLSWGRRSTIHLRNLPFNTQRLSQLLQLPSTLRVETAKLLSLRLSVPVNLSGIEVEADGVEIVVRLLRDDEVGKEGQGKPGAPTSGRGPQHRKAHRRLSSPRRPGALFDEDEDHVHIPTAEELAKSFLLEEPIYERQKLEASLAADHKFVDESIVSESSDSDDALGTGTGVPDILAGWIQTIVDQAQVHIGNVEIKFEADMAGDASGPIPVTLRLTLAEADVPPVDTTSGGDLRLGNRNIVLHDIALDLLSKSEAFTTLSQVIPPSSPSSSKRAANTAAKLADSGSVAASRMHETNQRDGPSPASQEQDVMQRSQHLRQHEPEDDMSEQLISTSAHDISTSDLEIQPGDDNISWGSRRSKSTGPAEDLWSSTTIEDDLPASLLLDRASTPRASSSRSESPAVSRTRRAVSPYDRVLESPGSWPRPNESPERTRSHRSPGSWPSPDTRQHDMFQSLTPGPAPDDDNPMDNKRVALQASQLVETYGRQDVSDASDDDLDEMAQSRMYSHEEAESLYMSAMTQGPSHAIPGGREAATAIKHPMMSSYVDSRGGLDHSVFGEGTKRLAKGLDETLGSATPRAQSPAQPTTLSQSNHRQSVRIVSIDEISVWLCLHMQSTTSDAASTQPIFQPLRGTEPESHMPGAFSTYSDLAASRQPTSSSGMTRSKDIRGKPREQSTAAENKGVEIAFGKITVSIDAASCRLLSSLVTPTLRAVGDSSKQKASVSIKTTAVPATQTLITVSIRKFQLSIMEQLHEVTSSRSDVGLLTFECRNVLGGHSMNRSNLRIESVKAWVSGSELLTFDHHGAADASTVLSDTTYAIDLHRSSDKVTLQGQSVHELTFDTLPIKLDIDLSALDDTLGSFGGLSGILELSSSFLPDGTHPAPPKTVKKPSKGVRFVSDAQPAKAGPEFKINGRFGGAHLTVYGESCAVKLQTRSIKVVHRAVGTSVSASQVLLKGPYLGNTTSASISINLEAIRLEYLITPGDKDLEKLLALLTPSKDKYDNADDILLDTLLRQRQKGSLLRASIGDVKVRVDDLDCVDNLTGLANELAKLSAVAKYLPEDDRPGILSMLDIKQVNAMLPVIDSFGKVRLQLQEVRCAHVGLPALLALSIGGLEAARESTGTQLVHAMLPLTGADHLPMIMARMLGDEAEPTVKVKLYNLCLEYDVATMSALIGHSEADAEGLGRDLIESITDLATTHLGQTEAGPSSPAKSATVKPINVELLMHDSGVGLKPVKGSAKGLLILTDAKASTLVPPGERLTASLELRKAALFVTDKHSDASTQDSAQSNSKSSNTATNARVSSVLSDQGYASVASLMTARLAASVSDSTEESAKAVEVEISSELLLLETCADSTQTLFAILGGLAPPSLPSKAQKYLTQPMTIEDMMASFTGEAVTKPSTAPSTLFDVDEEQDDDAETLLGRSALDDGADDLLMESEMASSLYGRVSGILDGNDGPDGESEEAFPETVESLLEDDPFEMSLSPTDMPMSDSALVRDLAKQCKPIAHARPATLGLTEIDDLGYEVLGIQVQALGSRHRFNQPFVGDKTTSRQTQGILPFRLKVRDTHIIWNLYDGYDWQRTRDGITEAVEQVEARAEQRVARRRRSHTVEEEDESVIGDFLFNSIYVGVPNTQDAQELRRQINRGIDDLVSETESIPVSGLSRPTAYSASGRPLRPQQRKQKLRLERSRTHKVAFELKGLSADVVVFPAGEKELVNAIDLRIRDVEIFDNLPTSTWRKFLTCLENDSNTREMAKPMAHIEVQTVRTIQDFDASELKIHVSLLPLRLHVDQDALDFVARFFEFKDDKAAPPPDPNDQPFIQRLEIETVDLQLDYKPKRIDYGGLRSGHTTELMNIITLDAANISLKHAIVYGIKGFEPIHKTLNDIWMPDVKRNQLPTVLAGLAPVRSLVNIGSGVRDVIAIPIREYRKDGRIVRSIQKGALHFGKTTTSELARLGAKLAIGTQTILQNAEGMLSPASASPSGRPDMARRISSEQGWHDVGDEEGDHEQRKISAYADQPIGVLSGLRSARLHLERDLLTARDAFIAVQGELMESGSPGAAAAAVARHAPTVILRPVIGATRAVGTTLLGVGNQIDRQNMKRMENKYKRR
ncbi:autophagy-related protein 2 [Recurvomyces mirabilis]|uniref:Autophagy-related protein 2 n=1 Tax=Recurvomyces mirabilis TaxID=574656 RepID=A0AAE1C0S8_9PEZI|nr:autophagy-related protein 2 [Recurvomyces mirabilis]KAK5155130.1 autophagy- protein 2 [Recurvomyces mirabilis]